MIKVLIASFWLVLFSCNSHDESNNATKKSEQVQSNKKIKSQELQGTWVRHNKGSFTLIEIKDSTDVLFYAFRDRKADFDTITVDRYWYYKSKAKYGYWNEGSFPDIWISTDHYRFDYKLKGDTLIEFDKMGEQGKLIKVHNDN